MMVVSNIAVRRRNNISGTLFLTIFIASKGSQIFRYFTISARKNRTLCGKIEKLFSLCYGNIVNLKYEYI